MIIQMIQDHLHFIGGQEPNQCEKVIYAFGNIMTYDIMTNYFLVMDLVL